MCSSDLFYGQRAISVDGAAGASGEAVRFLAHAVQSNARYAIDVEVKDQHVVRVTVEREGDKAEGQTVAALSPL